MHMSIDVKRPLIQKLRSTMSPLIFCVSRHPTFVFHRFPIRQEMEELTAAVEATKYLGLALVGTCTLALVLVADIAAVAVGVVVVFSCNHEKVTLIDQSIGPFMDVEFRDFC